MTEQTQEQQLPSPSLWAVLTDNTEELADGELGCLCTPSDESAAFRRGELTNLLGLLQNVLSTLVMTLQVMPQRRSAQAICCLSPICCCGVWTDGTTQKAQANRRA